MKCYLFQYAFFDFAWRVKNLIIANRKFHAENLCNADSVTIQWPKKVKKPFVGLVKDYSRAFLTPIFAS